MPEGDSRRGTVAFHTLGCKVNQYDTQAMAELFRAAGYEVVDFDRPADVYVINTCTVTAVGDKKSRQMVRRAAATGKLGGKDPVVVVTGCYAQVAPGEVLKIPEVDLVVGMHERQRVVELTEQARQAGRDLVRPHVRGEGYDEFGVTAFAERVRATIKIQEGCEEFCSYCKIPHARGFERSRDPEKVLEEARALAARGYREIVLTGINLGAYGRDLAKRDIAVDLADIALRVANIPGVERVRLSSIEPRDVTDKLIEAVRDHPRLCRHFHLPLQSGDDEVLHRMNRKYSTAYYADVVAKIREAIPACAVTTDMMAGFPGETEQEFANTYAFCERMRFSRMHVFPYSRRSGTPAAKRPGQVPAAEKRRRTAALIALGRAMARDYHASLVGEKHRILVESAVPTGAKGVFAVSGLTDTYVPVRVGRFHREDAEALVGSFLLVRVLSYDSEGVSGSPVEDIFAEAEGIVGTRENLTKHPHLE